MLTTSIDITSHTCNIIVWYYVHVDADIGSYIVYIGHCMFWGPYWAWISVKWVAFRKSLWIQVHVGKSKGEKFTDSQACREVQL